MASEPARTRLLWAILSLLLPVTFEHTTACRNPALTFTAAIHFAMKRSAACSTVFRASLSSWAVVVYWSALISTDLKSFRRHPNHFFPWAVTQPAPSTSSLNITPFGSLVSSMRTINPANSTRLLRITASMLSLSVFISPRT